MAAGAIGGAYMRKGFTLVELLIVMVVIGILAAMMMFSSTEAEKSARVQTIINNFNQIHKAVNAWYFDNMHRIGKGAAGVKDEVGIRLKATDTNVTRFSNFVDDAGVQEFMKYINNGSSMKLGSKNKNNTGDLYILRSVDKSNVWYVSYYLGKADAGVKSRFASKAKSIELFGSDNLTGDSVLNTYYTNQNYINMEILSLK